MDAFTGARLTRLVRMDAEMTQENKLALIIGFALMLVVGILVSDHLSELARGGPGSLASAVDPLVRPQRAPIEYFPLTTPPPPSATRVATLPVAAASIGTVIPPQIESTSPAHVVQRGETLHAIAQRYYGSARLAPALGRYNALPDPNRLRTGVRLLVPPLAALETPDPPQTIAEVHPEATTALVTVVEVKMGRYEVRAGDTLSELAQQLMGTARATQELWHLNTSVLKSPDALRPGMVLQYPSNPGTGAP